MYHKMYRCTLAIFVLLIAVTSNAQTLFTYGKYSVSKAEFEQAFNKNPNTNTNRKQALQEYLELYINYKLKVQAAYDDSLDKAENYIYESENFRRQLAETAVNNEANIDALVKEAMQRSQSDVQVSQVFIEVAPGADTVAAYQKIQQAYKALQKGQSFTQVVQQFASSNTDKKSNGLLGWITAFTLPYEVENIIYKLKKNQFAAPYHSNMGYHIFYVNATRKALGKRVIEQLLFPFPPDANEMDKVQLVDKANAAYQELLKGTDIKAVGDKYLANATQLTVGVGQYDAAYEAKVFNLTVNGGYTTPFRTEFGWHILKVVLEEAPPSSNDDAKGMAEVRLAVEESDRLNQARNALVDKWLALCKYEQLKYNEKALYAFIDSVASRKNPNNVTGITAETPIFKFEKQTYAVENFAKFVDAVIASGGELSKQPYGKLLKEYLKLAVSDYYRRYIQEFNTSMAAQWKEFNDANLLFAIMEREVWGFANADSAGLAKYYEQHAAKYQWQPSVSVLLFTVSGKERADTVLNLIKAKPAQWRTIADSYGSFVFADSSRFEQTMLPTTQKIAFKKGVATQPEKMADGVNYSFLYITQEHPNVERKSFADARGAVVADYQIEVEKNWLLKLKQKYPVVVQQAVFNTIQ
ncbi:MAG TPA: hypothetical protein DCL43_07640 [Chitinophagaceae bacterium]|nr:hypothetical protein [Chitinophagaceae bacterium]HAN39530.1 hypothetical protein [Chitinophagaceae bacterium]